MVTSVQVAVAGAALTAGYAFKTYLKYLEEKKRYNGLPAFTTVLDGRSPLLNLLPRIPGVAMGSGWYWKSAHGIYEEKGYDAIVLYCFLPGFRSALVVADAAMLKEITTARSRFPKPIDEYGALTFYGDNIVTMENQEWKRHRKVAAPAFAERTMKLVWDETLLIVDGLFDQWKGRDSIDVDHANDITMMMTLMIISVAGFGKRVSWKDEESVPVGHLMTFKEALHIVSTKTITKLITPNWVTHFNPELKRVSTAFEELGKYMREMVHEGKERQHEERNGLLPMLIKASELEEGEGLTDEELIGNIYIFLLAGHETSSHTLCFAMAYLALYPEIQEKLFKHIKETIPDMSKPTYADMPNLTYVLAVIYETLRMVPPVVVVPKYTVDDATFRVPKVGSNDPNESIVINVPAGTRIVVDPNGLHYNPKYWPNPYQFNPDRFMGDWPKDAFIPFSAGPRACIGRKFAETESVLMLALLVYHFKITIKEEPQFAGETFEQKKARVLNSQEGITTTPIRVPLTFTRRK